MRIGFDHDKYTAMQSEHILERINKFGGKLYLELGGKLFDRFNQHDPCKHAWYYRRCQALFAQDLADTQAYAEFCMHVENVFDRLAPLDQNEGVCAV